MTHALKPYPAYRDSGLPWLGAVPAHWEVRRLGQIGRLSKGNGGSKEDETSTGIPCVRYGDLYTTHSYFIEKSRQFISKDTSENYTPIAFGDVLFAASGETIDEIGKSAVNLMRTAACCGGDVILFRPEANTVASYMGYALDCRSSAAQKAAMGRGITVMHIYAGQLKRLLVSLPPIPEQAAIARYLDHVGARVDRYIDAKERLIALLKERKQAIIDRAVTRGLDPNAPMKPTGIAWMPEAPAHWEVRRLRNTADMRVSSVDKHAKKGENPVRLCNYVDVYKNDHIDDRIEFMEATATVDEIERFRLDEGDVLITKDSEAWDDIGVPALVTKTASDLVSGYHLALLRPRAESIQGSYLLRALQSISVSHQFHVEATGVTRYGLSHAGIKSIYLPLPPIPEQAAIAEHLERSTAAIDTAIARARRQIGLLREYRERLINDVVTGKLDVRGVHVDSHDPSEETAAGHRRGSLTGVSAGSDAPGA